MRHACVTHKYFVQIQPAFPIASRMRHEATHLCKTASPCQAGLYRWPMQLDLVRCHIQEAVIQDDARANRLIEEKLKDISCRCHELPHLADQRYSEAVAP